MFPGLVLTHKPDTLKHIPCGAPWCLCSSALRGTQQEFNRDTTFLLQHTLSTRNHSSCETMGWTRQHPASGGWFSEWDPVPRCTQDDTKAKQVTLQQPKTTTLHLLKLFQSYFHVAGESFMFRETFCFPNFICQHSFIQFFPSQKPWLEIMKFGNQYTSKQMRIQLYKLQYPQNVCFNKKIMLNIRRKPFGGTSSRILFP